MKPKLLLAATIFLAAMLRLYWLDLVPPSLYWDETSLGYNAYAISQTLRDEHGVFLPLTSFAAFGDYKPIGYIYAAVPFVKLLGLTEIAVRLPSVIAGMLLVLVSFLLVKEISGNKKWAMLTALFVAVSPWSLQMSRAAFEANLATFFSGLGVYFFLKARQKLSVFYILSSLFFALSMYTFNAHRVFVPLLVVALSLIYFQKKLVVFYLIIIVLLLPLVPHLLSLEGKLRFNEVTWLNDLSIVETANKNIAANNNALWAKVIYNRRVLYTQEFLGHYLDHFRFDFLFLSGDINPRLSTRSTGEMYLMDIPLVLLGIYGLWRRHDRASVLVFSWLLLAPVPAALARETPHALRILNVVPVPQMIAALGTIGLVKLLKNLKFLKAVISILLSTSAFLYLQNYYLVYPQKYSSDWQYGYKQMVEYVARVEKDYDHVDVTNRYGRPYIYFLFYNRYDPQKYWRNREAARDQFGFWKVSSFGKYVFDGQKKPGKTLFVRAPDEVGAGAKIVKALDNFVLYE